MTVDEQQGETTDSPAAQALQAVAHGIEERPSAVDVGQQVGAGSVGELQFGIVAGQCLTQQTGRAAQQRQDFATSKRTDLLAAEGHEPRELPVMEHRDGHAGTDAVVVHLLNADDVGAVHLFGGLEVQVVSPLGSEGPLEPVDGNLITSRRSDPAATPLVGLHAVVTSDAHHRAPVDSR